jgi:hypothetical protein
MNVEYADDTLHSVLGYRHLGPMPVYPLPKAVTFSGDSVIGCAHLGMEFEYEGAGYHHSNILRIYELLAGKWAAVGDGSLRGDDAVEFVFRKPLLPHEAYEAVAQLTGLSRRWQVSKRTGIHVHVDISNMTVDEFRMFLALYALIEPAVYTAAGDERSANPFSVPWFKDVGTGEILSTCTRDPILLFDRLHGMGKYSGLNLLSATNRGSAEFRHLRNTHDVYKIYQWMGLVQLLRAAPLLPDFGAVLEKALGSGDIRSLLKTVYRGTPVWGALLYPELEEEVLGIPAELSREIYYSRLPCTFVKPKARKKSNPFIREEPRPVPRRRTALDPWIIEQQITLRAGTFPNLGADTFNATPQPDNQAR